MLRTAMADGAVGSTAPAMAGLPGDDIGNGRPAAPDPSVERPARQPRPPVIRVDRNGILLEANGPGRALLEVLEREIGERLPEYITQLIPGALLSGLSEKVVVDCGGKTVALAIMLSNAPTVERLVSSGSPRRALVLVDSRESESSVLHAFPMALYTSRLRRESGETWMSPGVQRLTGFSPSQFLSSRHFWMSGIHPEDRPRVLRELGGLVRNGRVSIEYRFRCGDGSYRWMIDHMALAPREQKVFGIMQDIDSLKCCEKGLRDSNEFLEMMIYGTAHGVMVLDMDKNLLFLNPHLSSKLGLRHSDWVKERVVLRFHPKDAEAGLEAFSEALGGMPSRCTARIGTIPDTFHPFQLFLSPMDWRGKKLVLVVAGDMAKANRAEGVRKARENAGMRDLIQSAIGALAPGLSEKAAIRRINKRLGEPGRNLLRSFGKVRDE